MIYFSHSILSYRNKSEDCTIATFIFLRNFRQKLYINIIRLKQNDNSIYVKYFLQKFEMIYIEIYLEVNLVPLISKKFRTEEPLIFKIVIYINRKTYVPQKQFYILTNSPMMKMGCLISSLFMIMFTLNGLKQSLKHTTSVNNWITNAPT